MAYKTFWMVWCEQGNAPRMKHSTDVAAANEAERLARANPGKTFHVLRSTACCTVNDVQWQGDNPHVPF